MTQQKANTFLIATFCLLASLTVADDSSSLTQTSDVSTVESIACNIVTPTFNYYNILDMEETISDYFFTTDNYYYRFNFCQYITLYSCSEVTGQQSCSPVNAFAARSNSDEILSSTKLDSDDDSVRALTSDLPYTFDTEDIAANDTEPIHMMYTMKTEDSCDLMEYDTDEVYGWSVEVLCDPDNTLYAGIISVDDTTNPCVPYVVVSHASGCVEIQGSVVVDFCQNNQIVLTIIFLVGGYVFGYKGLQMIQNLIGVLAGFFVCSILLVFLLSAGIYNNSNSDAEKMWTYTILVVLIAILVGIEMSKDQSIRGAVTIIGFFTGYFIGSIIYYNIQLSVSENASEASTATTINRKNTVTYMFLLIALPSIVFGYLAYHFINVAFVVISSFMGSFCVVRAASIWIGNFPNMADVIAQLKLGQIPTVNDYCLGYLTAIIIIALVFIKLQWKYKIQLDKEIEFQKYKKQHKSMASVIHGREYVRSSIKKQKSQSSIKDGPKDSSFNSSKGKKGKRVSIASNQNPMIQDEYSGTDEEQDMFKKA